VKIEDGDTYGPVPKSELDEWVTEGRLTAESQVLRDGADQWQWASDLYPELEESPPEPEESAPAKPTPAITVDTGKATPSPAGAPVIAVDTGKGSPSPAAAPVIAVDKGKDKSSAPAAPVVDVGKDTPSAPAAPVVAADEGKAPLSPIAASVAPSAADKAGFGMGVPKTAQSPVRSRSYPAMDLASKIYRVLGWVVIVVAGLGALGYLINVIRVATALGGGTGLVVFLGTSLLFLAVGAVYAAISVITLWFAADAIKCILDIQNNTHRSNFYLQQLSEKQEGR